MEQAYTPINKICRAHNCFNPAVRRCPGCGWDFCEEHIEEVVTPIVYPTARDGKDYYNYTMDIPDGTWLCVNCDLEEEDD